MSKLLVRQEIPVEVKLTGNFRRWANEPCNISAVEVEVLAEGYKDRTVWVNIEKLMWNDKEWVPITQDDLEMLVNDKLNSR